MLKYSQALLIGGLLCGFAGFAGCATPPPPELPAAPPAVSPAPTGSPDFASGAVEVLSGVVTKNTEAKAAKVADLKTAAGTITIDCSVKLPDDPTDNPELCRSFQMAMVDEAGNESAHFRFGNDARYRFSAKNGKKYRIKPLIGKNWEFTVEPNRDLAIGERAHVRFRQKE